MAADGAYPALADTGRSSAGRGSAKAGLSPASLRLSAAGNRSGRTRTITAATRSSTGPRMGHKPRTLTATGGHSRAPSPEGQQEHIPWQASSGTTDLPTWGYRPPVLVGTLLATQPVRVSTDTYR